MTQSNEATYSWTRLGLTDILLGVAVPTIVALLILGVSMLSTPSLAGLKYILLEAFVVVGVPMLFGLIGSQWAGGASGFLLGSLYALFFADQLYESQGRGDISLLGNLVSAMLIGYIAGALNKRSDKYRRMLVAGVISGFMGALIVFVASWFSPVLGGANLGGFFLILLPRILAGAIVPLAARAFLRHGALQKKTVIS